MEGSSPDCYPLMHAVSNGFLQGDIPIHFALPLLTLQIGLVLLVTRSIAALFKYIKQPRVLAEIIGGVLLGPTALGRNKFYMEKMFPPQSIPLLETIATMGLMFFIFMVGLELDLKALGKTGRKAFLIGVVGIATPFAASAALATLIRSTISQGVRLGPLILFMGTPLSISAFSVLVRIMAELRLLSTDIGKLAVPSAAVNDVAVWTLLAVGVAIAGPKHNPLIPLWVLLCGAAFGIIVMTVVRMFMTLIAHKAIKEGKGTDLYVCITLMTVLLAGFFSDAIGVHPLLGPFLLGLIIPKDNEFPKMIIEKIEDFVTGLMLPLFFASSGLKTNLGSIHGVVSLAFLLLFFATAATGKIMGTFVTARLCGLPTRRALILGFLMNTKGLAVLIVLNIGRDLKALTDETFAILVLTCLLTSFITFPAVAALCGKGIGGDNDEPSSTIDGEGDKYIGGEARSLEDVERNCKQLRILALTVVGDVEMGHYSTLVNIVEAIRGNKKTTGGSPIKLYTLSLSQVSERHSGILNLVFKEKKKAQGFLLQSRDSTPFITSFQTSVTLSRVIVKTMSIFSNPEKFHLDITKFTRDKRASILMVPFYISSRSESPPNGSFSSLNYQKILESPPCSLGLLVHTSTTISSNSIAIHPSFFFYKVATIFLGGQDDREALSLSFRMADHPGVALKVIRLTIDNHTYPNSTNSSPFLDNEAISKLKTKALDSSIVFEEEHLAHSHSHIDAIKSLSKSLLNEANLIIVGRNHPRMLLDGNLDPPTELGVIGDIFAQAKIDSNSQTSILVIQKYVNPCSFQDTHVKDDNNLTKSSSEDSTISV